MRLSIRAIARYNSVGLAVSILLGRLESSLRGVQKQRVKSSIAVNDNTVSLITVMLMVSDALDL